MRVRFTFLFVLMFSATAILAQGKRSNETYAKFQALMDRIGIETENRITTNPASEPTLPEVLVQQQLDGYNKRDIDLFLQPYHDEVEIYNFPNDLSLKGIGEMRQAYDRLFTDVPDLHCELVNRIVMGDTVIDQEHVTGLPGGASIDAIAVYKIRDGKIFQVYFIR